MSPAFELVGWVFITILNLVCVYILWGMVLVLLPILCIAFTTLGMIRRLAFDEDVDR